MPLYCQNIIFIKYFNNKNENFKLNLIQSFHINEKILFLKIPLMK